MRPPGATAHATVHPLGNGLKRLVMAAGSRLKPDGKIAGDLGAQIEQGGTISWPCSPSEGMGPADLVKITFFTPMARPRP